MKVALQLYSIYKATQEDLKGALKAVKEMGYTCVEFADYHGFSAEEIKAMLDEFGLECISVHQRYEDFLTGGYIDTLKTLGAKFCAVPWMPRSRHKGGEEFMQTLEDFKNFSSKLKENGIQLTYHNHDGEFEKYEGKYLLDWLYEELPADVLETEIDTGWVQYAGLNPAEYVLKYKGRARTVHLKDFVYTDEKTKFDNNFEGKPIGGGIVDFKELIASCEKAGSEYLIVEVEEYDATAKTQIESAAKSRAYLKSLGI